MPNCKPAKSVPSRQQSLPISYILKEDSWRVEMWKAWRASGLTVYHYLKKLNNS